MVDQPEVPRCVVKLGGDVVGRDDRLLTALREVAALAERGWGVVVCHGGGPQTSALGRRLGLEPTMVAGQRVTDADTLRVACQAIAGEVGCTLVAAAWSVGLAAVGLSAGVVHGRRRPPVAIAGLDAPVDYGLVGDVTRVELGAIEACWAAGLVPVVSPLGVDVGDGRLLNINADTVASAVAAALRVAHLFAVTSVPGVLRDRHDPSTRIPKLSAAEARAAIAAGDIAGGMIPKVEEAIAALAGAGAVHILAAEAGALVEAVSEPGSRGTVLLPDRSGDGPRAVPAPSEGPTS